VPAQFRPHIAPATLASLAVIVAFAVTGALALGGDRRRRAT
jgi:hypothetical protein